MNKTISIYKINNPINESNLVGADDYYIHYIENKYHINLMIFNSEIFVISENDMNYDEIVSHLNCVFSAMELLIENNIEITKSDFHSILNNIDHNNFKKIIDIYLNKEVIYTLHGGKSIKAKTLNQKLYLETLKTNDIIFAIGPAGTGKTYLAIMYALKALKSGMAKKIVLVRPVVEAGEKLGFLPGDLKEKIDPYLVPIYDGLNDAIGKEMVTKYQEKGVIEVAPLAYMRGRTLENAIVILDEAQNSNLSQMKMFLTRLGFNSKMIITGDITQIDLPNASQSGLIEATNLLQDIDGIKIIKFNKEDVMRHPLVFKIIERYENK